MKLDRETLALAKFMMPELVRAVFNRPLSGDLGSSCNYYQSMLRGDRPALCSHGCYDEPRCITNTPMEGWPSERKLIGRIKWVLNREDMWS